MMTVERSDRAEFEVVVIGAGIGGLSAAAFLAAAGRRVLVVESSDRPGGLLAELPLPGYHMSAAVHNLTEAFEEGPGGEGIISAARRHLDLDEFELIAIEHVYSAHFPDFTIRVPSNREGWIDAMAEHFPSERRGLESLIDLCEQVLREAARFPIKPGLATLLKMPRSSPALFRYRSASALDVVDDFIRDERLKRAVTTLCEPYYALDPSEVSFLGWALGVASYATGAHYVRGGLQKLADSFADSIRNRGGEVWLQTTAQRITTRGSRVESVAGEGWEVSTPVVVAGIDPRRLPRLLDGKAFHGRYQRRLRNGEASKAAIAVYVAAEVELSDTDLTYESFIFDTYRLESRPTEILGIHIPTLIDNTLAAESQHLVEVIRFSGEAVEDPLAKAKEFIESASRQVPGLADRLMPLGGELDRDHVMRRFAHPYGWAPTVSQFGMARLPHETPLSGLFLTGHWTRPGHGIPSVIQSGAEACRMITDDRVDQPLQPL